MPNPLTPPKGIRGGGIREVVPIIFFYYIIKACSKNHLVQGTYLNEILWLYTHKNKILFRKDEIVRSRQIYVY